MREAVHDPSRPTAALRVLVVDDDADVREVVSFQVSLLGHAAVEADSVASARAVIDGGVVDAVVTDLDLAGEDGRAVARAATAAGLPAIGMTGAAARAAAARAAAAPAAAGEPFDLVLQKPVELDELAAALAAAVRE